MSNPDLGIARNRPLVILHAAVSLDGSTAGFEPDVGRFHELAATWHEDVTLAGADTILAQESALAEAAERPGPAPDGPTLAIVDGRGRVSAWQALLDAGYWSRVVAVHAADTPPRDHGFPEIVAGSDRVDLAAMLLTLRERFGAGVIRVDSGGAPVTARTMALVAAQTFPDGLVWLRHRVAAEAR